MPSSTDSEANIKDFLLLMHDDAPHDASAPAAWAAYLSALRGSGRFEGGSAIGDGQCFRQEGAPLPLSGSLSGYLRVRAESLEQARAFLVGNPVYEAGGTVEIRELPRD